MSKLYVISGHGAGDSGACGNGYQEQERVRALAQRIKDFGGDNVALHSFDDNAYASNAISSLGISKDEYCLIELHMDSASSASAKGGHVIIKEGYDADKYDTALANFISGMFPGRSQTIVKRSNLANVNRAAKRGYNYRLLECCFISNADDVSKFNASIDEVAKGILAAFGIGASNSVASTAASAATSTVATSSAANTSSSSSYDTTPDDVREIQTYMNKVYGSGLAVDGIYGKNTKKAIVIQVQKLIGTSADGIFGSNSKSSWGSRCITSGSKGDLVRLVQMMLVCRGYSVGSAGCDADCGSGTVSGIKSFQSKNGLSADGIAGKNTAYKLFA